MENNSAFDSFESQQLSVEAKGFLSTAAGWAMFLAIVGLIAVLFGLMASLGMMAGGAVNMPGDNPVAGMLPMMGIISLIITIVLFLPILYLFKFSISTKKAIDTDDTVKMTSALRNLKNYFVCSGILTIISIVSYIYFIVAIISNAAALSVM